MIALIKKKGINPNTKETLYYPQWTRFSTINKGALAEMMARGSTYSVGEVDGVITDFAQHICDQLMGGNAVNIQGLGTFKLKVTGKSQPRMEDVTKEGVTIAVVFEPDVNLTIRLNNKSEFKFVPKVTTESKKDAEVSGGTESEGPGGEQIGG